MTGGPVSTSESSVYKGCPFGRIQGSIKDREPLLPTGKYTDNPLSLPTREGVTTRMLLSDYQYYKPVVGRRLLGLLRKTDRPLGTGTPGLELIET